MLAHRYRPHDESRLFVSRARKTSFSFRRCVFTVALAHPNEWHCAIVETNESKEKLFILCAKDIIYTLSWMA